MYCVMSFWVGCAYYVKYITVCVYLLEKQNSKSNVTGDRAELWDWMFIPLKFNNAYVLNTVFVLS